MNDYHKAAQGQIALFHYVGKIRVQIPEGREEKILPPSFVERETCYFSRKKIPTNC